MVSSRTRNNLPSSSGRTSTETPDLGAATLPGRAKRLIPGPLRRYPWTAGAAALVLVIGVIAALAALGGGATPAAAVDPRTHVYADYTACLLTDAHGTAVAPASTVWTGMQQAAKTTNERVRTLPATGAQTLAATESSLNTLALQGCGLVLAIGTLPTEAMAARAESFPHTRFLAVGTTAPARRATNLSFLSDGDPQTLAASVSSALAGDFQAHGSGS